MFWCCERHLSIFAFAWQVSVAKLLKRQSTTKNKSPFCIVIKFPNQDGETGQGNAIDSVERWIVFTEYFYAKMKRVVFKLNFCCRSWIIWCKNFWVQLWKSWPLDTAGTADWFRDFQTWTRQDQQNSQQFPFRRVDNSMIKARWTHACAVFQYKGREAVIVAGGRITSTPGDELTSVEVNIWWWW